MEILRIGPYQSVDAIPPTDFSNRLEEATKWKDISALLPLYFHFPPILPESGNIVEIYFRFVSTSEPHISNGGNDYNAR
jgi:hypothetical protein